MLEVDTSTIPGGYSFERMRDALAVRVQAMPALREKLSKRRLNFDHPVWMADIDFDIDRHVHRIRVGPPGGAAGLAEICGALAALPLDRSRPLWEMWVIEGAGGPTDSRRLSVLLKVHHAAADGITFGNLLAPLWSANRESPLPDPVGAPMAAGPLQETLDSMIGFARRPLYFAVKVLPAAVAAVIDAIRRARAGRAMAAPFSAPPTVLNARFTPERNVAFARLDLGDVKKVKDHFGVKVNDVVAALVGGVVRQFLVDLDKLPSSSLTALEPVSVHGLLDSTARKQVSGMLVSLQTHIADPLERLMAVSRANTLAKEQVLAMRPTLLLDFGEVIGPVLLGIAKRVYARLTEFRPMYNVIVSNVPGPSPARYFGCCSSGDVPVRADPPRRGAQLDVVDAERHAPHRPDLLPDGDTRPYRPFRRVGIGIGGASHRDRPNTNSFGLG